MATSAEIKRLFATLRLRRADAAQLADILHDRKLAVYRKTLGELARRYGFDVDDEIALSTAIKRALRAEAVAHSRLIVRAHNKELGALLRRHGAKNATTLLALVEEWGAQRNRTRGDLVAITEAYGPHADATLNFFAENGVTPQFDFGGHGDADPACPICKAIFERNPHGPGSVLAIGTPHPQCRQKWHADFDPSGLPDELSLGNGVIAGIVGKATLIERAGGRDEAVRAIVTQEIP